MLTLEQMLDMTGGLGYWNKSKPPKACTGSAHVDCSGAVPHVRRICMYVEPDQEVSSPLAECGDGV